MDRRRTNKKILIVFGWIFAGFFAIVILAETFGPEPAPEIVYVEVPAPAPIELPEEDYTEDDGDDDVNIRTPRINLPGRGW